MNKRKPDDEFANIDLSYVTATGKELVVYCPESHDAIETLTPVRKELKAKPHEKSLPEVIEPHPIPPEREEAISVNPLDSKDAEPEQQEQHFTIRYDDMGYSYESIISPYLQGAKSIRVEDPYIRLPHQIQNFVRFCEMTIKVPTVKQITLITSYEDTAQQTDIQDKLSELQQSLLEIDVVLDIRLNPNMHDREIKLDNGWCIKIGRGLDFYQRPSSRFGVGTNDLSLRKCLETKVDIFRR
jgi:ATP-dependent Lon protease